MWTRVNYNISIRGRSEGEYLNFEDKIYLCEMRGWIYSVTFNFGWY